MGVSSGFLRRVKKPTPTGIRIKIKAKQRSTNPTDGERLDSLNVPCPAAVNAPNKQRNNPGQPQSTTAAMVAIMPVFLLFIIILHEMILKQYTFKQERDASKTCIPFVLTSQLRAEFMLQPFDDLIADRRSLGIGQRFLGLIGETISQRLLAHTDLFIAIDIE